MSIQDFIDRKKREFFVAKTPEGMQQQKEILVKEHEKYLAQDKLRKEIIAEQQSIRQLHSAPAREKLQKIQAFGKTFKEKSEKANKFFHGDEAPGLIAAAERREKRMGVPEPKGGIFDNPGFDGRSPFTEAAFGRSPIAGPIGSKTKNKKMNRL